MAREPNGRSGIRQGKDGRWHTWVSVGVRADGTLERKHLSGPTAGDVRTQLDDLEQRRERGGGLPLKVETLGEWLTYWLENVVKPKRAYKTYEAYRPIVRQHIIPHIGGWRIDGLRHRLEPEHVEALYAKLATKTPQHKALAPSYVLQVHRVLRKALKDAQRRGRASRNVCDLIDPPTARKKHVGSLGLNEAQAVVVAAIEDDMAARWLLGLLLGMRQGEVLGLRWSRVDLEAGHLYVLKQIQRHAWQHGCDDPVACAAPRHRTRPCNPRRGVCRRHRRPESCARVCPPGCVGHASRCPQRVGGGMVEVDTKSATATDRPLPLVPVLVESLRVLRERQIRERAERGAVWDPAGLVFTSYEGKPIDSRRDHEQWESLLERAGVKDHRLHAARHTAATLMMAAGADTAVIQEILRHADIRTTRGYMDVANDLKRQAVEKIAASLFDGALSDLLRGPTAPNLHR